MVMRIVISMIMSENSNEWHGKLCHKIYNNNTTKTTAVNAESTAPASATVVLASGKTPLVVK